MQDGVWPNSGCGRASGAGSRVPRVNESVDVPRNGPGQSAGRLAGISGASPGEDARQLRRDHLLICVSHFYTSHQSRTFCRHPRAMSTETGGVRRLRARPHRRRALARTETCVRGPVHTQLAVGVRRRGPVCGTVTECPVVGTKHVQGVVVLHHLREMLDMTVRASYVRLLRESDRDVLSDSYGLFFG